MENKLVNLTEMEMDALKEIGNIGTGNAATTLSKLLKRDIEIIIPEMKFIEISKLANEFGGPEKIVTSSYIEIMGELNGEALLIFPRDCAEKVVDIMMSQDMGSSKMMDDMAQSAFKEMSNIFVGSYLSSLADFFHIRILPSIPHMTTDMLQSIMDFIIARVSNHSDTILGIKTKVEVKDIEIEGFLIILFDIASMNKLLYLLKQKYK